MSADLPRQDFNYLVNAVLEVVRSGLGTENKPAVFRGDFNFVAVVPFQSVNHGHFAVLGEEFVKFFEFLLRIILCVLISRAFSGNVPDLHNRRSFVSD